MSDANKFSLGGSWVDEFECGTVQCFLIAQGEQVFASAFDEDFYLAKEKAIMIVDCLNQRDAYRELCAGLVKQLKELIAEAEFITQTDMFFAHGKLITKAEKILGVSNETNQN